jgi:hypothetical protein
VIVLLVSIEVLWAEADVPPVLNIGDSAGFRKVVDVLQGAGHELRDQFRREPHQPFLAGEIREGHFRSAFGFQKLCSEKPLPHAFYTPFLIYYSSFPYFLPFPLPCLFSPVFDLPFPSILCPIFFGQSDDKTTCPLSVTITLLIGLPHVASMAWFFSFASFTIRLMGALFGFTTATTLLTETMFSYPTLSACMRSILLSFVFNARFVWASLFFHVF